MSVQLSAIICTRNRADYLRKAIQSLVDQTLSPDKYEIIVVDNGSTDNTKAVIEEFKQVPNLHYLYEAVAGLSRARNTGWRSAKGEFIAYLDDDAVARPQWAEKYLEVFTTVQPRPGSVGGKAEPIWEVPQPVWLSNRMLTTLSVYHWADEPIIMNEKQWVAGCNVAYPVKVLQAVNGFREDLGRIGKRLLSGEESYVRRQLDKLGYVSMYHPDIVIGHHISEARLTKPWFRRHAYGTGQTAAFMYQLEQKLSFVNRLKLSGKKFIWLSIRLPLIFTSRTPSARFRRQCQVIESLGYISALWQRGVKTNG